MKSINRFKLLSVILVFAYLLSACSGAAPQSTTQSGSGKPQAMEVAFTGTVEAVSSDFITVNGQTVSIDAKTILDSNIKVGDIVKVEAQVSDSGAVLALKVESFNPDDTAANANTNDTSTNTNDNSNANDNGNANDNLNSNDNTNTAGTTEQEVIGVVDAISADSVTVDGVMYSFASSTEIKDAISAGDTVKLHVVVNSDGSLSVREIEKWAGSVIGDDNSNDDNSNVNDDHGNDNNSNDDHDDDNNSNDDHSDDDNNSNSNSNGG
ncbi:MAG: DUF5666 domain-containing protein [Anaerolineales bacterium]